MLGWEKRKRRWAETIMHPLHHRRNSGQHPIPLRRPLMPANAAGMLDAQVRFADQLPQVRKNDLHPGDWVYVKTVQSTYRIKVKENGRYEVSGGWFNKKGMSPTELGITGCTWGRERHQSRYHCGLRALPGVHQQAYHKPDSEDFPVPAARPSLANHPAASACSSSNAVSRLAGKAVAAPGCAVRGNSKGGSNDNCSEFQKRNILSNTWKIISPEHGRA